MRSRRVLTPEAARRMVEIREARRAAKTALPDSRRPGGMPNDTSASAQAVQDALWRRQSAAQKLMHVAQLSRMVDALSIEGLRQRNPAATDQTIRNLRAEQRLGRDLTRRVMRARRDVA